MEIKKKAKVDDGITKAEDNVNCVETLDTIQKCYYRFDISFTNFDNAANRASQNGENSTNQPYANIAQGSEEITQNQKSMSVMVATPDTVNSSSCYPDSGAANHVTCDLNNLRFECPYHGNKRIQMGYGVGPDISYIGHSLLSSKSDSCRSLILKNLLHVP